MIVVVRQGDRFNGHGSTMRCTGTSEDGSRSVTFAGDYRMMIGLMDAVREQGEVLAEVEEWAVLSTRPVTPS